MIRALEELTTLTVDVAGSATMAESPAVSELASDRIAKGVRTLRVDLRDCTLMDSTFSGTLLALKRQLEALGGTLTLVSPSATVFELLRQMGLEDFYDVAVTARAEGAWTEVQRARPQTERLQRMILDAHEELARVPGSARTFREVVEELRRDEPGPTKAGPISSKLTSSSPGVKLEVCSSASLGARSHLSHSSS